MFLGAFAGRLSETGTHNVFVGQYSGDGNISGDANTLIGAITDLGSPSLFRNRSGGGSRVSSFRCCQLTFPFHSLSKLFTRF